jgi:hypothetical protein
MGTSHIRSHTLKFQVSFLLSVSTLSNFLKPPTAPVTLDTVVLPPPAVLDPDLGARRRFVPGLGVRHHLDPGLGAHRRLIPDLVHAAAILFLEPIDIDLSAVIINLDPTSLSLCLRSAPLSWTPPPTFGECDTPPPSPLAPSPSLITAVV